MEGPLQIDAANGAALVRDQGGVRRRADGVDSLDSRQLDDREARAPPGDMLNNTLSLSNLQSNLQHSDSLQNCNLEQRDPTHVNARDGMADEQRSGGGADGSATAAADAGADQQGAAQPAVPLTSSTAAATTPLSWQTVHTAHTCPQDAHLRSRACAR